MHGAASKLDNGYSVHGAASKLDNDCSVHGAASKLDNGCSVHWAASKRTLQTLDPINYQGLRIDPGVFSYFSCNTSVCESTKDVFEQQVKKNL